MIWKNKELSEMIELLKLRNSELELKQPKRKWADNKS